jgi:hypothetical protein
MTPSPSWTTIRPIEADGTETIFRHSQPYRHSRRGRRLRLVHSIAFVNRTIAGYHVDVQTPINDASCVCMWQGAWVSVTLRVRPVQRPMQRRNRDERQGYRFIHAVVI